MVNSDVASDVSSEYEEEIAEETPVIEDLSNSDVVAKYKMAAEIANTALTGVLENCTAGKSVVDLCKLGDMIIDQRCSTIFRNKKIDKGVAFPTCISVNETVCHFSPLPNESVTLKSGDWVKVDLGCQVDGYIAVAAHTTIVVKDEEGKEQPFPELSGPEADVVKCAHDAVELCARLIKPGNTNHQVTEALEKLETAYGVSSIPGTVMHQLKRFVIDANKTIAQKTDAENKVSRVTFEPNEVYTIDICYKTGEDKPVVSERRTTVFKRQVEKNYRLKMKASRYVFSEVNNKYPTLPFTIRALNDETQARMGVVECVKHELIQPYQILECKPGDKVVHFKATLLCMASGNAKITGLQFPLDKVKTDKKVDKELYDILCTSMKKKKNNNKKKKKKAAAAKSD